MAFSKVMRQNLLQFLKYRPGHLSKLTFPSSSFSILNSCVQPRLLSTSNILKKDYFITTPIFYVNAVPHIGHLYSTVLADALSRWEKLKGNNVIFSTGTDEHGMKIQQAAEVLGVTPKSHCDQVSEKFKELFDAADINYSDFIRTTETRHIDVVHCFWNKLQENGFIYKGSYEGWYSTPDEAFLGESEVMEKVDKNGKTIKVSCESGHEVEWMKEDNYMFKLSEFESKLSDWLDKKVINPSNFEPLVRSWVRDGLPDLSVSRQRDRLQWGIQVPGDESQTIYVWLDALVNYLTVGGYPSSSTAWPADCHVVGKDILRFHAIYWPAFLMAADLEPPRSILCHSHWTLDNQKMSKSKGNVVDPWEKIDKYTADGLRYFLLKEGVPHSDGNYNDQKVIEVLNSELVNTLGNLANRCMAKSLNKDQIFPSFDSELAEKQFTKKDLEMLEKLSELRDQVDDNFAEFNIYKALDCIMTQLRETNGFIQHHKPWEIKKIPGKQQELDNILFVSIETLRICGILLQPVIPVLAGRILDRLNIPNSERLYEECTVCHTKSTSTSLGRDTGVLLQRLKS